MLNWLAVALGDCGIAGILAGLASIAKPLRFLRIPTRGAGAALFAAALLIGIVGLLIPAPREQVLEQRSDLDRAMPAFQFSQRRPHEMVLMTRIARNVSATINFRIERAGDAASTLATDTRVFAGDPQAERAFAADWRVIYPASSLIRMMWLRAIKTRAERG